MTDPRINHPPRISDLYGDERRDALYARHHAGLAQYMEPWLSGAYPLSAERSEPLWQSVYAGLVLAFGVAFLVAAWGVLS